MAVIFRGHFVPPRSNQSEISIRIADQPIHLRRNEVDCSLADPSHRVGADSVILPVTARTRTDTIFFSHISTATCHTGRTDTETHPRFRRLDIVVDLAHHIVDMVAAPVELAQSSALFLISCVVFRIVRLRQTVLIEIVVEHDTVHIILVHDVGNHIHDTLFHFRKCRIENRPCTFGSFPLNQPLRMAVFIVLVTAVLSPAFIVGRVLIAIRVQPRINLNTTFVGFFHQEGKRVESRRNTACSRNIARPRLVLGIVHGIAHGTNMIIDCSEIVALQ